jgi:hypothetical protein
MRENEMVPLLQLLFSQDTEIPKESQKIYKIRRFFMKAFFCRSAFSHLQSVMISSRNSMKRFCSPFWYRFWIQIFWRGIHVEIKNLELALHFLISNLTFSSNEMTTLTAIHTLPNAIIMFELSHYMSILQHYYCVE